MKIRVALFAVALCAWGGLVGGWGYAGAATPEKGEVAQVQRLLSELGYNIGPADGMIGKRTTQAILEFQKGAGITPDGEVSPGLFTALEQSRSATAASAVSPSPVVEATSAPAVAVVREVPPVVPAVAPTGDNVATATPAPESVAAPAAAPVAPVTVPATAAVAVTAPVTAAAPLAVGAPSSPAPQSAPGVNAAAATLAGAAAEGGGGELLPVVPPSVKRILDRKRLIVAMYHKDTPPFYYVNQQGELDGIDVQLIKGFARQMGVEVFFDRRERSFNQLIEAVARREADLAISKLGMTFPRAMQVSYSLPYISLHQALLINRLQLAKQSRGRPRQEVIRNLEGKIGVLAGSSYVDNAKERFKKMTVVEYKNWDQVVKAAAAGEVVAAYRDDVEIKQIVRDHPDTALNFLTVVIKDAPDPKAIVVSWDSAHLLQLINFYIAGLELGLTADKVLEEYDQVIKEIQSKTR